MMLALGPYLVAEPAAATSGEPGPLPLPRGVPLARVNSVVLERGGPWLLRHLFLPSTRVELGGAEVAALLEPAPRVRAQDEALAHGILVSADRGAAWRARRRMGIARLEWITWGGIGDVLLSTPLLRAVRRRAPWLHLSVRAVRAEHLEVLAGSPYVDDAAVFDPELPSPGAETLRFHPRYGLLNPSARLASGAAHAIAGCLHEVLDDARPALFPLQADVLAASRLTRGLDAYLAVHTTGNRPQKGWSAAGWAELSRRAPLPVVQVGAPGDLRAEGALDLRGLPLGQSLAVVRGARAFVGVDSALQHAAAALGVPAVVLFGPTPAEVFGHPGAVNLAVEGCACRRDVARWTRCAERCLASLPPEAVIDSLRSLLAAAHAPALTAALP